MTVCKLINTGTPRPFNQRFECEHIPRQGELIAVQNPETGGDILNVEHVMHRSGASPYLFVSYYCSEQNFMRDL